MTSLHFEQPSAKVVIDKVYESIADLRERCKPLFDIFEKMNPSTIEGPNVRDRISQFEQHALQGFTEIGTIQAELSYTEAELNNFLYQDFRKKRRSGKIGPVRKATKAVVIILNINHSPSTLFFSLMQRFRLTSDLNQLCRHPLVPNN